MSPSAQALTIISAIAVLGSLLGFLARFHRKMDLEQWTVGGRGFGLLLVWLLMAGEIYTTFTFLGASGWAYSKGGPVLYVLGYAPLMYVVSFYILPPVWEAGVKFGLQTQADFFQVRYGNKYLAALVAAIGVVSLIPYLQIQLTGLGLIVEVASFGTIHRTPAMVIGFALVAGFVFASGVRGVAWVSILKDALMVICIFSIGIAVPHIYFGGVGKMFAALISAKPAHLVMPGSTRNLGHAWFITSVFMTAAGFYMWPQYFACAFTAKNGDILRRNAVIMPLYGLTMSLVLFVGFSAVLVLPGLRDSNLVLLAIVQKTFPAWFLGVVGGAAALTAMVPAAIQLLTGATLYAKNLFRPVFAPGMTDRQTARLAKIMVLVLTLGALFLAVYTSPTLVDLLILGYAGVSQLFPGVVLGLFSKRANTAGISAGILTGVGIASLLMLTGRDPYYGMNAGFVALACNFAVTVLVSAMTPASFNGFEEPALPKAVPAHTGSS